MVPESGTMLVPRDKAVRRMALTYTGLTVEWEKERL